MEKILMYLKKLWLRQMRKRDKINTKYDAIKAKTIPAETKGMPMTITDITTQKKNPNRVSIYVDGVFAVGMDAVDAHRLRLKPGMAVTEAELEQIREEAETGKAQQSALKLAASRSYTVKGMTDKLTEKGYSPAAVAKAVQFLTEYRYLDDEEYTRRYIADCLSLKGDGFYKIRQELSRRGVPREIAERCLTEVDIEAVEREAILPLIERRLNGVYERKSVERVKRWLIGKGYSYDTIQWGMEQILREHQQQADETGGIAW